MADNDTQTQTPGSTEPVIITPESLQREVTVHAPEVTRAAPTTKTKPVRGKPVNAEQQKELNKIAQVMLGDVRRQGEAEAPAEAEAAPQTPAATPAAPARPTATATPAKPAKNEPEDKPLTKKDLVEITAKAAADAVTRAQAAAKEKGGAAEAVEPFGGTEAPGAGAAAAAGQPAKPAAGKPGSGKALEEQHTHLTAAERRQLPVLREMEKLDPERYKGLEDKFVIEAKIISDYVAKWERENPAREFNPEDTEHDEFFEKHKVDWEDSDFQIAAGRVASQEQASKIRQDTNQELSQIRLVDRARELGPSVEHAQKTVAREMFGEFKEFGEAFAQVIGADLKPNQAAINTLWQQDPAVARLVFGAVERAEVAAAETVRLFNGFGLVQGPEGREVVALYDAEHPTPLQKQIVEFAARMEGQLMALPEADRLVNGKPFASSERYWAMPPRERAKHWTYDAQQLNILRMAEIAEQTRPFVQEIVQSRASRGAAPAEPAQPQTQAARAVRRPAPGVVEKPVSPSDTVGPTVSTRRTGPVGGEKEGVAGFMDGFFNGKSR